MRRTVVEREVRHGEKGILLALDAGQVADARRKGFREGLPGVLLRPQVVIFGGEILRHRTGVAALAAALEVGSGRDVRRVAAAVGILRLHVGLLRRRDLRIERNVFCLSVVLQVGGFEPPVALFAVAVVGSRLRMADFMPSGVVFFEACADRSRQIAALKDAALRLGLHVHHLLLPGRGVALPYRLGAQLLVDPHALDVRGFQIAQHILGIFAEEIFAVDQHPFDLLAAGEDLVVLDLDARKLSQKLLETVVGHGFERSGVVDRGVALEDHGDLLAHDHDLCDRLFVDLHLDLDAAPEFGRGESLFIGFVSEVGDLQIDRVAEDAVAFVDGQRAVEILLGGGAPQRVGAAHDRNRGPDQRVFRLLVLDGDCDPGAAGAGAEVNPRHSAPHDLCGERAGKAEKGDEQQGVTCQAERKREVLRCKIAISVPIAQSVRKKEYSAAGRSDARCCRRRFVICLAGHP